MATTAKTPIYFISHGGPNIMYDTLHPAFSALGRLGTQITAALAAVPGGAKGVVVFSAHWQGGKNRVLVNVDEGDGLIYDFYGFPDHYYKEKYPHSGSRELAEKVLGLLENAGIKAEGVKRDIDHGVWAGFKCMFDPEKNPLKAPIVQVSLYDNEDAEKHYNLGKAVASLREQGYMVVCSGMAVHNLRDLRFTLGTKKTLDYVHTFDAALKAAVADTKPGEERKHAMEELLKRPDARKAHPEFDHLLPIYRVWTFPEMSMSWAQYRFGEVNAEV
ncbi:extradiol ring-cleavage dioxygenase [Kalaharituber pfeilii]|nr:extradiol ring-cleavage dioxygenase [Kalaharituber pfeilii]